MKKATLLSIMLLVICITNNAHAQKKYSDVRLKENGWIRIENSFVETKKENSRRLYVRIQFLNPCTATTLYSEVNEELSREMKTGLDQYMKNPKLNRPLSPKSNALLTLKTIQMTTDQGKDVDKLWDVYYEKCEKGGIDATEFLNDMTLPQFRCNYRTKVFVTFFSKQGVEITTEGKIPWALLVDSSSDRRKTEMVPGETMHVLFFIPDGAESWQIWVPK